MLAKESSEQSTLEIEKKYDTKINEYIEEKKTLYANLISFIENPDSNNGDLRNVITMIDNQNEKEEEFSEKIGQLLQLVTSIANNHYRVESFFNKIFQIIENYKEKIKQTFSNKSIFNIFRSNKRILLFLFENDIIKFDKDICNEILVQFECIDNNYYYFFYPEIKKLLNEEKRKKIESNLSPINSNIFEQFEENRHKGENESYICSLIREDSVEEFISYVNRKNIDLTSEIGNSIFETNSFLIKNKKTTLIEYAAFFGSIQIFQYLRMNNVKLEPSVWMYAIHSQNAELIHLLEDNEFKAQDMKYQNCFYESVKCHHNDIADYIENTFLPPNNEIRKSEKFINTILKNHNYAFFPSNIETYNEFYNLNKYKYNTLAVFYIKKEETNKTLIENNQITKDNRLEIINYYIQSSNLNSSPEINITKIVIPPSITSIGSYGLQYCYNLEEIIIPSSVTSIGNYAFYCCWSLIKIEIPSSITIIEKGTFCRCSKLQQITIPSSVKSIGNHSFFVCESLNRISIPFSVTSIGDAAFSGCKSLRQINIPSSVTSIGRNAFEYCSLNQFTIPSIEE